MEFFSGDGDDAPDFMMSCSVCKNPIDSSGDCLCAAASSDADEVVSRLLANFLSSLLLKMDAMALPDLTPATPSVRLQRSASALLLLYSSHSSADASVSGGGPILDVRYAENGVSIDVEDADFGNHEGDEAEDAVDAGDDGDEQELPLTAVRITFQASSGIASRRRRRRRVKVELMGGTLCWSWLSGIIVPLRRRIRWCIYENNNGASGSESTEEEEEEAEAEPEFKDEEEKVEDDEELCCVCYEALSRNGEGETEMLPCMHVFHWECLRRWMFEYKSECPLCRTQFTV